MDSQHSNPGISTPPPETTNFYQIAVSSYSTAVSADIMLLYVWTPARFHLYSYLIVQSFNLT
jgi:hypothetical protein